MREDYDIVRGRGNYGDNVRGRRNRVFGAEAEERRSELEAPMSDDFCQYSKNPRAEAPEVRTGVLRPKATNPR